MSATHTRVATYARVVGASLDRVRENVYDWEHLPWLHRSSFRDIRLRDRDARGWHADIWLWPREPERHIELELRFEPSRLRYVSRTLDGPGAGSEIWTDLEPRAEHETRIRVEFLVPGDPGAEHARALGRAYEELYARLWDEDEGMMRRREQELATKASPPAAADAVLELGGLEQLRSRLPLLVQWGGRAWRLVELDGALLAHAAVCPHMLGPLDAAPLEGGCVRCPWHGYRFDVRSGLNPDGRRLRLPRAPRVDVDARGSVRLLPPDRR